MSHLAKRLGRSATLAAAAGALVMTAAGPAAAHHCYRDWQDQAQQRLAENGTAWVPLSDYLAAGLAEMMPDASPACLAHVPEFTQQWMDAHDVAVEPLIQVKGTVGGGAFHKNGKAPGPTHYLSEADFDELIGYVMAEPDCAPPVGDGEGEE